MGAVPLAQLGERRIRHVERARQWAGSSMVEHFIRIEELEGSIPSQSTTLSVVFVTLSVTP